MAERSLQETARLSAEEYPKVNPIVQNDISVDDCLSGEENVEKALKRADELELVLDRGGFTLKLTYKSKWQFECSGENTEKYIKFSVPIGKRTWR